MLGWALRQQTFHHRNAGWMARLINLSALAQAMLPEWQARWYRSLANWSGDISIVVGSEAFTLRLDGRSLQLLNVSATSTTILSLTQQAFVQAIFGYRPIAEMTLPENQPLSSDLITVLSILFPVGQTYIPASDWF